MPSLFHPSSSRGFRDWDWLKTAHSFSFANYWDPNKMGFGLLRVLNDDAIAAGQGFDLHPHHDMEIVTIPLSGTLRHEDVVQDPNVGVPAHRSAKRVGVIGPGDVQVMSAGTGITHSEFNASETEPLSLLQLWVETDAPGHAPRYEDRSFPAEGRKNKLQLLVSPDERDGSLMIHQQAFFLRGEFDAGLSASYALHDAKHGVHVFLIEGEAIVNGQKLEKRDAVGIWDESEIKLEFNQASNVLLIEVPMG